MRLPWRRPTLHLYLHVHDDGQPFTIYATAHNKVIMTDTAGVIPGDNLGKAALRWQREYSARGYAVVLHILPEQF